MPDGVDQKSDAYLGQGWAFPMQVSVQGGLQTSRTIRNIEESIQIILRTELGERVYRPNFGSRLSELTFAPLNTQTLLMIRLHVKEALQKWEPRIEVDAILTDPDPMRGRVDITIEYHCKASYDKLSLVYPFYLMLADGG
ncbi:MAG: GPW/gp25 family protein [Oculatellaceae cyanobacterium Prado106]|jgi:hypothetical protein|nr:GPW/gp25 family protein [Oculatellaceae cyanobacterium Prado106]